MRTINFIFTCAIFVWMVSPYLFRNTPPLILVAIFSGWFFSCFLDLFKITMADRLFAPIIWLVFILTYRILDISTASWGNYGVQVFFWINIYIGYISYKYYDNTQKRLLIGFIWMISFANILHNIILLIQYPGASTFIYQPWGTEYLTMNIGDTAYGIIAIFFLLFNLSYIFLYKKNKLFCTIGCIISFVYLYQSARTTTWFILLIILFFIISYNWPQKKNAKGSKDVLWIGIIYGTLLFFIVYPFLIEILATYDTESEILERLIEISNIIYGSDFDTVDSGTGRLTDTFISLTTWTSSLKNFLFGVGFHGKDATYESIKAYGIGQHSESFDTLARYGLLGGIAYIYVLYSSSRYCLDKIYNKDFFKIIYYSLFIYSFMNSFLNASYLSIYLFVVYPLAEYLNNKDNNEIHLSN